MLFSSLFLLFVFLLLFFTLYCILLLLALCSLSFFFFQFCCCVFVFMFLVFNVLVFCFLVCFSLCFYVLMLFELLFFFVSCFLLLILFSMFVQHPVIVIFFQTHRIYKRVNKKSILTPLFITFGALSAVRGPQNDAKVTKIVSKGGPGAPKNWALMLSMSCKDLKIRFTELGRLSNSN